MLGKASPLPNATKEMPTTAQGSISPAGVRATTTPITAPAVLTAYPRVTSWELVNVRPKRPLVSEPTTMAPIIGTNSFQKSSSPSPSRSTTKMDAPPM